MAIVNRTKDASEQRDAYNSSWGAVATGVTLHAALIPFNSTLEGVRIAVAGVSGAPTYALRVLRFIVGTGVTTIAGGATTLTPSTVGTSGVASMSLASSGSTLLNLLAGDLITITSGATDAAVTQLSTSIVIKGVQDIKTWYGI